MTNKEAIEILRLNTDFCDAEFEDAIILAISALEKQKQKLPATQPEIIYCCECSNWDPDLYSKSEKRYCLITNTIRNPDDFCSRAKRRREPHDKS